MTSIFLVALAGKDNDANARCVGEEITDQGKTLVRPVRQRRQAEVDQGQCGCLAQLLQQGDGLRARRAGQDVETCRKGEAERLADQRVVIDNQ